MSGVELCFIANAVDRGTFPQWVAANAKAIGGVAVAVGRGDNRWYRSDRVYMLITLPPEPRAFKLVIGWKDHDDDRTGDGEPPDRFILRR